MFVQEFKAVTLAVDGVVSLVIVFSVMKSVVWNGSLQIFYGNISNLRKIILLFPISNHITTVGHHRLQMIKTHQEYERIYENGKDPTKCGIIGVLMSVKR